MVWAVLMMAGFASAQTWMQTSAPTNIYVSIASSADGSNLIAGANSVFLSTNSGATWISNNLPTQPLVSISADGTKMTAVGSPTVVSTNSGATWITNISFISPFSLAASADGSKLIALNNSSAGIISTNYGITWKNFSAPGNKVTMSADGTKSYFAVYHTTNLFVSTNLGTTASRIASPSVTVISLAVSADGRKLIAGTITGPLYISTNSGTSWTATSSPVTNWFFVGSSADGSHLIGASRGSPANGSIYTSSDSGLTWISNNIASLLWSGVASSADGGELLAIYPNNVFISKTMVLPNLNLTSSSNNLTLGWIIPSTNFVLQQSSDLFSWADVTNPPVLNFTNLQNQVTLTQSGKSGFYRLKTP